MSGSNVRDMSRVAQGDEHIITAEAMEHVLGTGDLSKLTVPQRVQYYLRVCDTVGINPMTRPFRFLNFQGQVVMYATRDCTDQLREKRKISIELKEKRLDGDLFIVTAHASTPEGRQDEDVGAVMLGRSQGDARANAIMRAITKSKRRVTLSICGLGYLDEDEVATLPGALTYEHDAEAPKPPAAKGTQIDAAGNVYDNNPPERPEVKTPQPRPSGWAPLNPDGGVAVDAPQEPDKADQWLNALQIAARDVPDAEAADKLLTSDGAMKLKQFLTERSDARIFRYNSIVFDTLARFADPPKDDDAATEGGETPT